MRCHRVRMSISVCSSMCPMCRDPVTFGGGITIENTGPGAFASARNNCCSTQARAQRGSICCGSYAFGISRGIAFCDPLDSSGSSADRVHGRQRLNTSLYGPRVETVNARPDTVFGGREERLPFLFEFAADDGLNHGLEQLLRHRLEDTRVQPLEDFRDDRLDVDRGRGWLMGLRECSRRSRASRRFGGNFLRCVNFACRSVFYFPFLQGLLFRLEGLRMLCWRRIEFLVRKSTGPTGRNRLSRLSNLFFPKVRGRRRSPGSGGGVIFFFGIRRNLRKRAGGIRRMLFKAEPRGRFLFHKKTRVGFR